MTLLSGWGSFSALGTDSDSGVLWGEILHSLVKKNFFFFFFPTPAVSRVDACGACKCGALKTQQKHTRAPPPPPLKGCHVYVHVAHVNDVWRVLFLDAPVATLRLKLKLKLHSCHYLPCRFFSHSKGMPIGTLAKTTTMRCCLLLQLLSLLD